MSRGGISGFQPERIAQILAIRRLTQLALSAMVDVSPATMSKWRSGTHSPEPETLDRLAKVVNVTPEWFTRPCPKKVSKPLFRSNASAHVAARAMLEARMEWSQEIALAMSEFVDFPPLNLPHRNFPNPELISHEEIELAATECREIWRLGKVAVQDLTLAAEGAGVIIIREETGIPQIEGLSAWSEAVGRPFVLLSSDKDNCYRSRFDLAHEIGHLVLHRHVNNSSAQIHHNLMEKQAHAFAGALLLPAESFVLEVHTPVTLDDLLLLKRRWGASVAAIMMRLHALGLIDDEEKLSLFKRRSVRWGSKAEPGDQERKPECPRLLQRTVNLLIEENVMPKEAMPRHFGLSATDIESLSGLPSGYFKSQNNVIQLAKLKRTSEEPTANHQGNSVVIPFRSNRE